MYILLTIDNLTRDDDRYYFILDMETTSTSASLGDRAYKLNYLNNRVVQLNIEN